MGCASSRSAALDSPLVALCRERRDLIHSAAAHRYALASAHAAYFRSLSAVGDALHRFFLDDLSISLSSCSSSATPLSHSLSSSSSSSSSAAAPSPNYYYTMSSTTAIPSVVFEWPGCDAYYYETRERAAADTPPPPPPQGSSAWNFFNPFFELDDQHLFGYYDGRYGVGSVMSSPNWSEVRAREGIPDLEEDTEQEVVVEMRRGKEKVVVEDVGTSCKSSYQESGVMEKRRKGHSVAGRAISNGEEEVGSKRKGAGSGGESSMAKESGPSNGNALLSARGTRDVMEVMDEIRQLFNAAAGFGTEVAEMLEVGRVPYQPGCDILTVFYSRILDLMDLPLSTFSHPFVKRQRLSSASHLKKKTSYAEFEKHIGMQSGNLSSTLEKLYVWEKKLYKEVKDEEKLRIMYNKKWRQLRCMDDRGAKSQKIDSTRASIRNLSTKISIVIKSIDTISSRVHKIRDEELQPQMIELIQGLIRMWKSLLDCHQKQLQALVNSKSHKLMAKAGVRRNSIAKATRELEMELLRWCSSFTDWISTQKAYLEALNGWMMKWLIQEHDVTSDGVVPFSPSRAGAPAAFIISNDWCRAVERMSEVEVTRVMCSFAGSLHEMWESQKKEHHQKLKVEYLSRDFERRLKSLQKANMVEGHSNALLTMDGVGNNDTHMMALHSLRKRLDEEKAKHEETIKHIQQAASSCLRTGLVPILETLGNSTLATMKAYEELRIPTEGKGT